MSDDSSGTGSVRKSKFKAIAKPAAVMASIAIFAAILYLLADRYLIEHVEADAAADLPASGTAASGGIYNDDWTYTSKELSVKIQKVQTGTGNNLITYFIADVELKGGNVLHTAFAKNLFGRNIVEKTSAIASANDAVFAVNGDYYGFRNDGVIIRSGIIYRDIPVREAAAVLTDSTLKIVDENEVTSAQMLNMGAVNTFSFGPALVKDSMIAVNTGKITVDTNLGNREISVANPRAGIGMISPGHFIFIVVDGRASNYSRGMTLYEFARLFASLGCETAYNLDGGGSATMYFMGRVVNDPLGRQDERKVSDIIYVN